MSDPRPKALLFAPVLTLALLCCKEPRKELRPPAEPPPAAVPAGPDRPAKDAPPPEPAEPTARPLGPDAPITLRVIAAPTVARAVEEIGRLYALAEQGQRRISVVAAGHADALRRMSEGGADVVVTEGHAPLEALRAARLVAPGTVRVVGYLPLTVVVSPSRVEEIRRPSDLAAPGRRVGVPDPNLRTGLLEARRLLARAGVRSSVREILLHSDPEGPLRDGTIDAFVSFGRPPGSGLPLDVPEPLREYLAVPAAATSFSANAQAAASFVRFLAGRDAAATWASSGIPTDLPAGAAGAPTVLPIRLPLPRRRAACAVVVDRALLVGGESAGVLLGTLTWVNPELVLATDALAKLPSGREGCAAAHIPAEKQVLVAGGRTSEGPTTDVLAYDPGRDRLDMLEMRLPLPMSQPAAAAIGSVLYLFGGRGAGDALLDAVVSLDASTGVVTRLPAALPSARAGMAAVVTGQGIWLLGGESVAGAAREILSFDPKTGETAHTAHTLESAAIEPIVAPWENGWLVAGGLGAHGPRDVIETIEPDGTSGVLPHRLPYPLSAASAASLWGGVYIMGGASPDRVEARVARLPY